MLYKLLIFLGAIWTLPNSIIGLLLGVISGPGQKYRFQSNHLAILSGSWGSKLVGKRIGAITFGNIVIYFNLGNWASPACVRHESEHVRQYMILGIFFLLAYSVSSLTALLSRKDYYKDNVFEKHARLAEKE